MQQQKLRSIQWKLCRDIEAEKYKNFNRTLIFLNHGHYLFQNSYKKKSERTFNSKVLERYFYDPETQILVSHDFTSPSILPTSGLKEMK